MAWWWRVALALLLAWTAAAETPPLGEPSPRVVYKDFGQKTAFNQTFVVRAARPGPLAVSTSRVFPHDRLPFPGSQAAKCDGGRTMRVAVLFEMEEAYTIGCCVSLGNRTHRCPAPPLHDANPLLALVSNDRRPVHFAIGADGPWHRGGDAGALEYAHDNGLDGFLRAATTLVAVTVAVGCGIAVFASHVHGWANRHPWLFVVGHVAGAALFAATMVALFLDTPDDPALRASVVHLALQAVFSALLVYTPADGYYAEDQRFPVHHGCGDAARHAAANGFLLSALFNAFSVHAVVHMVWARFEAPFDVLFFFLLGALLTLCTLFVAFATALYGVHEPLRIGDGTVVLGDAYGKVASEASRRAFYDYGAKAWTESAPSALGPGTVVAMDPSLRGWVVGTFEAGELFLTEHAMAGVVPRGFGCGARVRCRLPDRAGGVVPLYCVDARRCFVRIGQVGRDGQARVFHTGLYAVLERLLRLQRTVDDEGEYELNVVETLRRACHRRFASRAYVVFYAVTGAAVVVAGIAWPVLAALRHPAKWFLFLPPIVLALSLVAALHHAVFAEDRRLGERAGSGKRGGTGVECALGKTFPESLGPRDGVAVTLVPGPEPVVPSALDLFLDGSVTTVPFAVRCPAGHPAALSRTEGPSWVCDACQTVLLDRTAVFHCKQCNWCACCHPPVGVWADEARVYALGRAAPFSKAWTFRFR